MVCAGLSTTRGRRGSGGRVSGERGGTQQVVLADWERWVPSGLGARWGRGGVGHPYLGSSPVTSGGVGDGEAEASAQKG